MKSFFVLATGSTLFATLLAPSAQDDWRAQAMPGPGHARLAPLEGDWSLVLRTPGGEGGAWSESPGSASFRWKMGGRFLVEEVETRLGGEPFEWMGIHGFDNSKKRYDSSWIDNLGTGIDRMEGTWDEATKSLTYVGEVDEGGEPSKVEWTLRLGEKDRFTVEMATLSPDGKQTKNLEIVATRRRG
jgi:hypothetical protein